MATVDRSDRSYDKVHFLFHAVVEWVSCSGGIQRGQVGVGAGGRRTEVGRLGGGSVGTGGVHVWSGGNRAGRQGVGMVGACGVWQASPIASGS